MPGREPSAIGAVGSVIAFVFGIFWTMLAYSMTRNFLFGGVASIFPLFGLLFIIAGIFQAVYHFSNATRPDRFSAFDISDDREEPDPLNRRFSSNTSAPAEAQQSPRRLPGDYCPYCGAKLEGDFDYCPKCGKDV